MGVVADLDKRYQQQIRHLRADLNALYRQSGEFASRAHRLQEENDQLRGPRGRQLAQQYQPLLMNLRMENAGLHGLIEEQAAKNRQLQQENDHLRAENLALNQRLLELTEPAASAEKSLPPAFVKANVPDKPHRKPGRPAGHEAALREPPTSIDVEQTVALPIDEHHKPCCPHCKTQLSRIRHHRRLVEDLEPAKVITTGYTTTSGYCPRCRKHVESRAADQPPPADVGHAQLGLHALSTVAVLRVCYRLPLRQISQLYADLPGLRISAGAITKQIQRLGRWLEGQYDRLGLVLRAAGCVHADETGWRTNGKNGYLWTLTDEKHTLYHVDRSRGGQVIANLLGETFAGTLVSDFYAVYDQFAGPQQKCLAHLLRELHETVQQQPDLANHAFFQKCKSLLQQMLRLKKKQGTLEAAAYNQQVKGLETRLHKLAKKRWDQEQADRLAERLDKYQDRLTTFLHDPAVDGTNNAAERALRPAVVMRKITGGSRSEKGAKAWSILASVMRTAQQQGQPLVTTIEAMLRAAWAGQEPATLPLSPDLLSLRR
jgi:transposase